MKRFWAVTISALLIASSFPYPFALSASTTLTFSPSSKTVTVDDEFTVRLVLNTDQAVNASDGTIRFPKDLLQVKSVSKSSSVFTLWTQGPSYSNGNGTVTYSGGVPNPGVTGNGKTLFTVTFEAEKDGTATLTLSGASVLANDGYGTEVLSGTGRSTITIEKRSTTPPPPPPPTTTSRVVPVISSSSHPDETVWYNSRDVSAEWRAGSGVRGYSVVFDDQTGTVPPQRNQGLTAALTQTVGEGVWYLHVRALYDAGWSDTRHFAVRVDATPPETIVAELVRESERSRSGSVTFTSNDALSGIDRFSIKLDAGEFVDAISPYAFSDLSNGDHTIVIRALDKAGNETTTEVKFTVQTEATLPVTFEGRKEKILGGSTDEKPLLITDDPIRLNGYARLSETVRITVRSEESVFTFPVADVQDPNPVEPAPPGYTAWKVEIKPDLAPGDHEVQVETLDTEGNVVAEAPTIQFRVITNVAQVGGYLITFRLIVIVLSILAVLGIAAFIFLLVRYIRLRRHKARKN